MSQKVQRQPQQPDCDTLKALIPAYSVGATDPEETALVEQLLPLCPEGQAELDEYLALSQAMHYTVPLAQPPAHLHDKLMAALNTPAAKPAPTPNTMSVRPQAAPPGEAQQPKPTQTPPARVLPYRLVAAVAAIAAALLIISNLYWVNQVNTLRDREQQIVSLLQNREAELTSAFSEQEALRNSLQSQQIALAALGTGRANRLELASTDATQTGTLATVLWNPQSTTALLYSDTLPPLPADQTYQVWVIGDANPISVGTFAVDEQGVGVLVIQADAPMDEYGTVAISTEPAGGSEQPTTTPIAAAQI
jgi:anti-sigma-K factor RskA